MYAGAADADTSAKKTIGLLIYNLDNETYATPSGKEECPHGFAMSARDTYAASVPPGKRPAIKLLELPLFENMHEKILQRGPHGEDVCYNPTLAKDPPMPISVGKGYGVNLDGTSDGHATPQTCAHQKFSSPSGEDGIDNQVARLLGCVIGYRPPSGFHVDFHAGEQNQHPGVAYLMEISGVEDERNSPAVTVNVWHISRKNLIYRAADGKILPGASYRYDPNPREHFVLSGKIVNGVLITDPAAKMRLTDYMANYWVTKKFLDASFRIRIGPQEAEGRLVGYWDFDSFWSFMENTHELAVTVESWSCPAMYEAARKLADGYKDPHTGNCNALSFSYQVKAVRAFIVKPGKTG
jgi:hypothetical protein